MNVIVVVSALMAKQQSSLAFRSGLQHLQSQPFHLCLAYQTEALIHVLWTDEVPREQIC